MESGSRGLAPLCWLLTEQLRKTKWLGDGWWRVPSGDGPGWGGSGWRGSWVGRVPASGAALRTPAVSCLGAAVSAPARGAAQRRKAIGGSSWPPTTLKIIHPPRPADPGGNLVIPRSAGAPRLATERSPTSLRSHWL